MSGLLYADGFLPVRIATHEIRATTQEYEEVTVWDGVTLVDAGGAPSKYEGEFATVVGPGTAWPFGLTLETLVKLFMRPRTLRVKVSGLSAVSGAAGSLTIALPSSEIYLDHDTVAETEPSIKITDHRDLVRPPMPRFQRVQFEDDPPVAGSLAEYSDTTGYVGTEPDLDYWQVLASALIFEFSGFATHPIYKVGGLYYPQFRPFIYFQTYASHTATRDDVEETPNGTTAEQWSMDVWGTTPESVAEGTTREEVPVTFFGEDLGHVMLFGKYGGVVTDGPSPPTDVSAAIDPSGLTIDIGVPESSAGWLDYGGIYDEDTGERV